MAKPTPLSRALAVSALAAAALAAGLIAPAATHDLASGPDGTDTAASQAAAPVEATSTSLATTGSALRAAPGASTSTTPAGSRWTAASGASIVGTTQVPTSKGVATVVRATRASVPLATTAVASGHSPSLVTVWLKGDAADAGRQVVLETSGAAGQRQLSAPVTLQPWWQTASVTATPAAGTLRLAVLSANREGLPAGSTLALSGAVVAAGGPTVARTQGRVLLVNGQPFVMQGASYWPSTPGGTLWTDPWSLRPEQCATDAQLMRAGGVNTIRIPFFPETYDAAAYRKCMDAFAGAGVRLMWLLNEGTAAARGSVAFTEAFWVTVAQAVNAVKDHPATLGYAIGNEVNYTVPDGGGWFESLDELAKRTKALDPLHVTTTSVSGNQIFDDGFKGVSPTTAPHLDMWGLNVYVWLDGWAKGWGHIYDRDPTRPVWFSEWGPDRYRCVSPVDTPNGGQCKAGSGEDQRSQADWVFRNWLEIGAHLSVADGRGIVGGLVFLWSDNWWMQVLGGGWGTPLTHDAFGQYSGWTKNHFPDGHFSVEWSGITMIQPAGATGPRVTTAAYDALAWAWTGAAGPAVSPVRVDAKQCSAVVRFTTSVPTVGRVDYGPSTVNMAGGFVLAENYVPESAVQEPGPHGDHAITISDLLPGTRYSLNARGIDGGGRAASAPTLSFTTPLGAC